MIKIQTFLFGVADFVFLEAVSVYMERI